MAVKGIRMNMMMETEHTAVWIRSWRPVTVSTSIRPSERTARATEPAQGIALGEYKAVGHDPADRLPGAIRARACHHLLKERWRRRWTVPGLVFGLILAPVHPVLPPQYHDPGRS